MSFHTLYNLSVSLTVYGVLSTGVMNRSVEIRQILQNLPEKYKTIVDDGQSFEVNSLINLRDGDAGVEISLVSSAAVNHPNLIAVFDSLSTVFADLGYETLPKAAPNSIEATMLEWSVTQVPGGLRPMTRGEFNGVFESIKAPFDIGSSIVLTTEDKYTEGKMCLTRPIDKYVLLENSPYTIRHSYSNTVYQLHLAKPTGFVQPTSCTTSVAYMGSMTSRGVIAYQQTVAAICEAFNTSQTEKRHHVHITRTYTSEDRSLFFVDFSNIHGALHAKGVPLSYPNGTWLRSVYFMNQDPTSWAPCNMEQFNACRTREYADRFDDVWPISFDLHCLPPFDPPGYCPIRGLEAWTAKEPSVFATDPIDQETRMLRRWNTLADDLRQHDRIYGDTAPAQRRRIVQMQASIESRGDSTSLVRYHSHSSCAAHADQPNSQTHPRPPAPRSLRQVRWFSTLRGFSLDSTNQTPYMFPCVEF